MTRFCAVLLALAGLLFTAGAVAETRVALVVGVANYDSPDIQALPNAVKDAAAMHAKLLELGFGSVLVTNPTRGELRAALSDLFDRREQLGAETALIFFAGHGVQFGNAGYLLARDSALARSDQMEMQQEVSVSRLLDAVGEAKFALLLLDACRNSPAFTARLAWVSGNSVGAGLPLVTDIHNDAVVSYSAEPGARALDAIGSSPNSPYATALLDYMGRDGIEIGALLQGVRRYVESVTDRAQSPVYEDRRRPGSAFYFRRAGLVVMRPASAGPSAPVQQGRVSAREALALLSGKSGAARSEALAALVAQPGLLTPVSVAEALALLGDIPVDTGRRSRALAALLPLLERPIDARSAQSLLAGLGESGRLAALSDMFGCMTRPLSQAQAGELIEGIPRRDIPWVYRELTSTSGGGARCGK